QANIFDFIPAIFISNPIPPLKSLQSQNSQSFNADFDRSWYQNVGNSMIITMGLNIVSPHLISLFILPCTRCLRSRDAQKQLIQRDMNNLVVGPPFDLTHPTALVLNTIFVT